MSQAAIDWLEDEEVQERIVILRDIVSDYSNLNGLITAFTYEELLTLLKESYKIIPSEEDIEFIKLKDYFVKE